MGAATPVAAPAGPLAALRMARLRSNVPGPDTRKVIPMSMNNVADLIEAAVASLEACQARTEALWMAGLLRTEPTRYNLRSVLDRLSDAGWGLDDGSIDPERAARGNAFAAAKAALAEASS